MVGCGRWRHPSPSSGGAKARRSHWVRKQGRDDDSSWRGGGVVLKQRVSQSSLVSRAGLKTSCSRTVQKEETCHEIISKTPPESIFEVVYAILGAFP
jgi:hypothetical protein